MGDRSNVACFNGEKALQVPTLSTEPTLIMSNGISIPQLAFGMYKIPATDEGETIVGHAIKAAKYGKIHRYMVEKRFEKV
eukprot:scaffold16372_cov46-Attheya_sp.AAC.2